MGSTSGARVIALVLNYVHWEDSSACIQSLLDSSYKNLEIFVIDNCSPNDSEAQLRSRFSGLTFYQTGKNLGYTGGINFGINKAFESESEYIFVINPDTTVEPECLELLVGALNRDQDAAIAGGTIVRADDPNKVWYAGGEIVPWKGVAEHYTTLAKNSYEDVQGYKRVSFVTGCAMLLRTDSLKTIGLLDERFFMYLDDVEFCVRAENAGFQLIYVPAARITHNVVWVDKAIHKMYYSVRNRYLLIHTSFVGYDRWFALIYFTLSILVKMINWRFGNDQYFKASKMGIEDYLAHNFGPGRGLDFVTAPLKENRGKAIPRG